MVDKARVKQMEKEIVEILKKTIRVLRTRMDCLLELRDNMKLQSSEGRVRQCWRRLNLHNLQKHKIVKK